MLCDGCSLYLVDVTFLFIFLFAQRAKIAYRSVFWSIISSSLKLHDTSATCGLRGVLVSELLDYFWIIFTEIWDATTQS